MGPLRTLRVVEMAGLGPAPFCAMLLADLGADVVRIERPGGSAAASLVEPRYDLLNRGKRSAAIDLKAADGAAVALRLIERADVLLEGFRPGVMERLGLGPAVCLARNRRLVYGRMTGWGQEGPLAARAGHDINFIALAGALHAIGSPQTPVIPLNLVGDFGGGGLYLMIGVLAALVEREQSGRGQVVDAAIVDGTASLLTQVCGLLAAGVWTRQRGVNLLDGGVPWYAVYETRDDQHVAVGAIEPAFYRNLMRTLGLEGEDDVPDQWDAARWPELRARLASVFRTRTRDEWARTFAERDACVAPICDLAEAAAHPHLHERGTFVDIDGVLQPAPTPRFSRTPAPMPHPPAVPGRHTRDVLREVDLTDEEIADLVARGVVSES
jgi:alpha-methylacyl-CoA racemase